MSDDVKIPADLADRLRAVLAPPKSPWVAVSDEDLLSRLCGDKLPAKGRAVFVTGRTGAEVAALYYPTGERPIWVAIHKDHDRRTYRATIVEGVTRWMPIPLTSDWDESPQVKPKAEPVTYRPESEEVRAFMQRVMPAAESWQIPPAAPTPWWAAQEGNRYRKKPADPKVGGASSQAAGSPSTS